jgi:hypothetical protein
MAYPQFNAFYIWKSKTFHPELFGKECQISLTAPHRAPGMVTVDFDPYRTHHPCYCVNRRRLKADFQGEP